MTDWLERLIAAAKVHNIEFFIPVKGFEGFYECSNFGNIRSLDRIIVYKNGGKRLHKGRVLSRNNVTQDGHVNCVLYKNGSRKDTKAHIPIFYSFNPEKYPIKGYEIDHIDDDPANNRPENLQQITYRQNSQKRSMRYKKSSKFIGVTFDKTRPNQPWIAQITKGKKHIFIGRYKTEELADSAFKKMEMCFL